MDDTLKLRRGTAVMFTSGACSDFRNCGFLVTVKDCDLPALAQQFAAAERERLRRPHEGWQAREEPSDFPSWLVANGYAFAAEAQEIHIGDYGDWEPEFGVPAYNQ